MSSTEMDNLNLVKSTFLLHHDPDLELTTGESFSSINNDTSQCLFCSNVITGTPIINLNLQNPCQSSLDDFARLFKISTKTLFQGTNNYESVLTNLPCVTCAVSINNAVKLLDEIERLQAGLDAILNLLKSNLFKSYERRRTTDANEGKEKSVEIFQKTFIQCWTDCKVEVTRLGKQRRGIRRGKLVGSSFKRESFTDGNTGQMSNQNPVTPNQNPKDSFEPDDCVSSPEEIITDLKPILAKHRKTKKRFLANKTNEKSSLGKKGTMTNRKVEDFKDYPFVCKTCGKGYYLNHYLKIHERTHSEGRSLSCSQCSLKFYCNRSLRLHQVKMHGMTKTSRSDAVRKSLRGYNKNRRLEWFLCRHCQKKFDCKDLTGQDGKLRVIIDDITETFETFSDFRKHHFMHCQERPPEETHCDVCRKDFTSGKMLEDHRTVFHTKEFPFYCDKCGVGKINKSALNKHMLVHTNAKNFHCPICLQSFKRNVQLKFHMMRHNNDLPFMCDLCGKRFTDKQKLKRHRETHSEDKKYPCPQCEKLFVSKSYVYHHIWDTHKKARRPKASPPTVIKDPPVQDPCLLSSGITTTTTVSFIGLSSSNNMGFQVPTEITFI